MFYFKRMLLLPILSTIFLYFVLPTSFHLAYVIYVTIGLLEAFLSYKIYFASDSWKYEKSLFAEILSLVESPCPALDGDQSWADVYTNFMAREIRIMLIQTAFTYWPITFGRIFIQKGSDVDQITRTVFVHTTFEEISDIIRIVPNKQAANWILGTNNK